MDRKSKLKTLDKYVIFSITMLMVYTVVQIVLVLKTGVEASTLTTCFFGVFGGEILTCGLIKIFKLRGAGETSQTEEGEANG